MMLWDSLPVVRLRNQFTESSPCIWRLAETDFCILGPDTISILSIFFNDCVAMEI